MDSKEYIQKALRTEPEKYDFGTEKLPARIEHAAIGLVTESGEIMSQIKRAKLYGTELDKQNLIEEAGDIFWYMAILADELGLSFEEIQEANLKKLQIRYPEKFNSEDAVNRNTEAEHEAFGE